MGASDVIVVGAGVVGCATAHALARAGASVRLIERDGVAEHASRAAAGMLAPLTESGGQGAIATLGLRSLELFPALVDEVRELSGIDPRFQRPGVLRVGFPEEAERLRAHAHRLASHGAEWLERDELCKREPRVASGLAGALWSPREAHVDGGLLTRALAGAAARRGAELELGCEVVGLLEQGPRIVGVRTAAGDRAAAHVVLCTGAWAGAAADWFGGAVPVTPIKGQLIALEAPVPTLPAIVWGRGAYLVPRSDGTLVVGATVERAGFDPRATAAGVAALVAGANELVPDLAGCGFERAWAGLRPGTPDDLPLVGAVPGRDGLTLAAGHYRNGLLLAPLTGEVVANSLLKGGADPALVPFDPCRFALP